MSEFIEWATLPRGNHRRVCPLCTRSPADRTMGAIVLRGGAGLVCCFRCGFAELRHTEREKTDADRIALVERIATLSRQYVANVQRCANESVAAAMRAR